MPQLDAFEAYIEPELNTGCWLWTGSVRAGYGQKDWAGRNWRAHRLAWTLYRGSIPAGLCVCHRCDTPLCVNPGHLFLGTSLANVRDAQAKGRLRGGVPYFKLDRKPQARGWKQPHRLISASEWAQIRERAAAERLRDLAAEFGVSVSYLSQVLRGKFVPLALRAA